MRRTTSQGHFSNQEKARPSTRKKRSKQILEGRETEKGKRNRERDDTQTHKHTDSNWFLWLKGTPVLTMISKIPLTPLMPLTLLTEWIHWLLWLHWFHWFSWGNAIDRRKANNKKRNTGNLRDWRTTRNDICHVPFENGSLLFYRNRTTAARHTHTRRHTSTQTHTDTQAHIHTDTQAHIHTPTNNIFQTSKCNTSNGE